MTAPWTMQHRDLCDMLYTRAVSAGAEITFDSAITAVSAPSSTGPHPFRSSASALGPQPSVTLSSGDVVHADLIIGADGAQSLVRAVVDEQHPGSYTGTTMYTGAVHTAGAAADRYLKEIVEIGHPIWMGEGVFGMGAWTCFAAAAAGARVCGVLIVLGPMAAQSIAR